QTEAAATALQLLVNRIIKTPSENDGNYLATAKSTAILPPPAQVIHRLIGEFVPLTPGAWLGRQRVSACVSRGSDGRLK
ncbi:MAG: hypothetical protein ACKO4M_07610, partial [Betaproteobacteria bacterium]